MNQRLFLWAVIGIVVLVAAVVAVIGLSSRQPGNPTPSATESAAPPVKTTAAAKVASAEHAGGDEMPAEAESAEPAGTEERPAEGAVTGDPASLAVSDPKAFVDGLSDRQSEELYMLLRQRAGERQMKEMRYNMMTDTRLQMIGMMKRDLALSDAQKQQIAAIKEAYRPQLAALLSDNWAKQDELNRQMLEAQKGLKSWQEQMKFHENNRTLFQQQVDLSRQADELAKPLDEVYLQEVRGILTAEQLRELDNMNIQRQGAGGMVITNTGNTGGVTVIGGSPGGGGMTVVVPADGATTQSK
jgi:hypothetical protein